MKKYLRIGEIPPSGKSVNYLKMTYAQNEDFTQNIQEYGYEFAVKKLPEDVFEAGISVFELDIHNPIFRNLQQLTSFCSRVVDRNIYEVTGDIVGTGNDGEPLLDNVHIVKQIHLSKKQTKDIVLRTLCSKFRTVEVKDPQDDSLGFLSSCERLRINIHTGEKKNFYDDFSGDGWVALPDVQTFIFSGWFFSDPVEGFDTKLGF